MDTVFQKRRIKVDEKTNVQFSHTEICKKLFVINLLHLIYRLQFYDHLILNNDICPQVLIAKVNTIIDNRYRYLVLSMKTCSSKLIHEDLLVYAFKKTRTETEVNFISTLYYLPSQLIISLGNIIN